MYIVDFIKVVLEKRNIPTLIYLLVNVGIIALLSVNTFNTGWIQAFISALIIYFVSLVIALSPFGEWILRLQTGCKKIRREDYKRFINPIFEEVYAKAKSIDKTIPNNVKLFMLGDDGANAFATGRRTICITRGMLNAPVEEIKAVLGHEFGHLAHKDTDLILVVCIGNFLITTIFVLIRMFARIVSLIFQLTGIFVGELAVNLGAFLSGIIVDFILISLMKIWTKVGMLLVMKSSRSNEYAADEFSANLGYGKELCMFLDRFDSAGFDGLFATLVSSHPASDDRIAKLQSKGVDYYLQRL